MKVHIIDDCLDDLNNLELLFNKNFPQVDQLEKYSDPFSCVEILKKDPPQLLILDMEMPGMSGIEFIRKLNFINFEVIFCTSHEKYAIDAFKNHAIGYLFKPFTEQDCK
ncbi:response regulator [Galbibacter sp. EGI 63066]|uniref:LytR/AlgR family response regulator transcription factor n=1 Tax=Galbibacter sp. EGI 63066 TaxID=2993559 RepID=UPI002248F0A1|nr:response regulator [Galbibacter sp. EGI 63066]MCX2681957.1 response regulator [Galbibacter sp. EGI 63066]